MYTPPRQQLYSTSQPFAALEALCWDDKPMSNEQKMSGICRTYHNERYQDRDSSYSCLGHHMLGKVLEGCRD
jgi:hypothetical protein